MRLRTVDIFDIRSGKPYERVLSLCEGLLDCKGTDTVIERQTNVGIFIVK